MDNHYEFIEEFVLKDGTLHYSKMERLARTNTLTF
jgi:hypothetical protein